MANGEKATLTAGECMALYQLIDMASGGNADDAWGSGPHDPRDLLESALVKVYGTAGRSVPEWAKEGKK